MLRNRTTKRWHAAAFVLGRSSSQSLRPVSTLTSGTGLRSCFVAGSSRRQVSKASSASGWRCYSQSYGQGQSQSGQDNESLVKQREEVQGEKDASSSRGSKEGDQQNPTVILLPSGETPPSSSESPSYTEGNSSPSTSPAPNPTAELLESLKDSTIDSSREKFQPNDSAFDSSPSSTSPPPSSTSLPPNSSSHKAYLTDLTQSIEKFDLESIKQRLREWSEQTAITVRTRADEFTSATKTTFSQLGAHLNKATGYEEIEALKREVVEQETRLQETREAAKKAKISYSQAVIQRSNSQRQVNDLLQRKSHWSDHDVSRFPTLMRQDRLYEQEETRAKQAVDESESNVEKEFSQLMRTILARYHEEQVWSDKIRSASTYGSLAALALNLIVFVTAILFVEPWKRRRLAQTFEKKVDELSKENAERLDISLREIGKQLKEQEIDLVNIVKEMKDDLEKSIHEEVENAVAKAIQAGQPTVVLTPWSIPPTESSGELQPPQPEQSQPVVIVTEGPKPILGVSQRLIEYAGVGAGAFILGVVGTLWFGR
ncbi:hypothetical protein AX16_005406 [Volvariella volvacea WC 439]|nr:hypothetical protein AX16_005406 [Volvariella volvacea WC 439]